MFLQNRRAHKQLHEKQFNITMSIHLIDWIVCKDNI